MAGELVLGHQDGSEGTFRMTGYGSLSATTEIVGQGGTGSVYQSGFNTHIISGSLSLGLGETGVGSFELRTGALSATDEYIGVSGTGTFTHVSGTNTAAGTVYIALNPGSNGTYHLQGGTLTAGGIHNADTFNFSGGTLIAPLTNMAQTNLTGFGTRTLGAVTNEGTVTVAYNTSANFTGTFTNRGAYLGGGSDHHFVDMVTDNAGYLTGGAGDNFYISNDFINSSTQNASWDTHQAYLGFTTGTGTAHDVYLTGNDYGAIFGGYANNFAWGTLSVAPGNTLSLFDGNAAPGGALYATVVQGVDFTGLQVNNITGNGLTMYYDAWDAANSYLAGQTYSLLGGGQLVPVLPGAGDFDGDGHVRDLDIDTLANFIRLMTPYEAFYDLTGASMDGTADGSVDVSDLDYLVRYLVETTIGQGSEYGDFNLDGTIDTTDLTRLATNFGPNANWALGNANGNIDTTINTTDLAIMGTFFNFTNGVDNIPEPATLSLLAIGGLAMLKRKKQ